MNNKFKSLRFLLLISDGYQINLEKLNSKFSQFIELIRNTRQINQKSKFLINSIFYIFYLLYLISPIHLFFLFLFYFYINNLLNKKVILSLNNSLKNRWQKFINYDGVFTIFLDSKFNKIFLKRLPYKLCLFIIYDYINLLITYISNSKNREKIIVDILALQKFLNDFMIGVFISGNKIESSLDGAAYTLTYSKYIGIKFINKDINVNALQVHAASKEPMMIFFQADKVLSMNLRTSIGLPQVTGERKEIVVGSRLLENYINKNYESLLYKPEENTFLVLFGNTHHPKGLYYGRNHNDIYKNFLDDLMKLSEIFPNWKFFYLHHRNYKFNYENNYLLDSSFKELDPKLNVYSTSLKYSFVVSYASTVVTELYSYHPNIYLYSPSDQCPYRVIDNNFRFISDFDDLKIKLGNINKKINQKDPKKIYHKYLDPINFDERVYQACLNLTDEGY